MVTRRGTSNQNARGGSKQRQRRKVWLLATFGDGFSAPCSMEVHHQDCPGTVDADTLSVDRYPLAGADGGTYRRDNIRPAFGLCNSADGGFKSKGRKKMPEMDMSDQDKERGAAAQRAAKQATDEAAKLHKDTEVAPAHPVVRTGGGLTSG